MDYDLAWLANHTLTGVDSLGPGSWRFAFGDGVEVRADCPWRLVHDGGIAVSSEDHGHQYGLPHPINAETMCRALIGGAVVRVAEVRDETLDIVIAFESGTRLELIPLSSGYESWQVAGPGGSITIAQGGGSLAIWSGRAEPHCGLENQ